MSSLRITGRVLYLSADPARVRAQFAGTDLNRAEAGALRDDISTDEITPLPSLVYFDDRLADYAHTGFSAGDEQPIAAGELAGGGFQVLVGGWRYGKGSSREHSPLAEYGAGVRLIIAESFERLYRQNCDNIGLFTTTDFGLLDRVRAGEPLPLEALLAGRDALASAILREGGLLAYGRARLHGVSPSGAARDDTRAYTLVEKIIVRHRLAVAGQDWDMAPGSGGFVRAEWRFIHEIYTGMAAHLLASRFGDGYRLYRPDGIVLFEDHNSYAHRSPTHRRQRLLGGIRALSEAHRTFARRHGLRDHGHLSTEEGSEGISHAMMAERYALPGQVVVGTDSHTPHCGALGALAYGVGTTDMANAFLTGACRLTMPETLLVRLEGRLAEGVTAKDVALRLLAEPGIKAGAGVGRVFEFAGPVIESMLTDERATLTNMTAELGGLSGIVAPDAETVRFVRERRGETIALQDWMRSDAGARYAEVLRLDCSDLGPMLAAPGDPGNGLALAALSEPVRVDIAYGGSCTAGKRADFDHYHAVLSWAAEQGLRVAEGVTFYLQCGTVQVREYCAERGYLEIFAAVGAELLQPACGACAQCGPGVSTDPRQVTVSAVNRNFPGRAGPGQVWLASPPTVAASAIAGELCAFRDLKNRVTGL